MSSRTLLPVVLLGQSVERGRVVHQDALPRRRVRRPFRQQIEQRGVVRLVASRSDAASRCPTPCAPARPRCRPARPRPTWRKRGGARLDVHVGAGQFHPGVALVEHAPDHAERRIGPRPLRQPAEMIEHDRCPAAAAANRAARDDLIRRADGSAQCQPSRLDALRQRLDHVERGGGGIRIELGEADAADAARPASLQLGVGDGRMHHRDAACAGGPSCGDGVERHRIVGARWRQACTTTARLVPMRCWNSRYSCDAAHWVCMRDFAAVAAESARRRRCAYGSRRRWPGLSSAGGAVPAEFRDLPGCYVIHTRITLLLASISAPVHDMFRPPIETDHEAHYSIDACAAAAGLLIAAGAAQAHAHVWITMTSTVLYAPDGAVTGVRQRLDVRRHVLDLRQRKAWRASRRACSPRGELRPLAEVNVTSLKEYEYLQLRQGERQEDAVHRCGRAATLSSRTAAHYLHFALPAQDADEGAEASTVKMFDPSYFIDFSVCREGCRGAQGRRPRGLQRRAPASSRRWGRNGLIDRLSKIAPSERDSGKFLRLARIRQRDRGDQCP